MSNVFPATLENGVITWGPNGAPPLPVNVPRAVEVVVVSPVAAPNHAERNRRRKELLLELVRRNTFGSIDDPVEYIREMRKDRPQPGRDE